MDSCKYRNSTASCFQRGLTLIVLLGGGFSPVSLCAESLSGPSSHPYAAWEASLTLPATAPFPPIEPFDAEYRFGWERLSAGGAQVHVGIGESDRRTILAQGGPNSWIRKLWNYHALYVGESGAQGEVPSWFHMEESVSSRSLFSDAVFKPGSVFACHHFLTESKPWEFTELPGVRDLFAAMLFVRSQPLHTGEHLRMTVFPDQNPYLVDLTVAGHDTVTISGKKIRAIRFTLRIQTIETRGERRGRLAPHRKFHSGRIWMSDDAQRLPLRAEVDIFIGRVFAEMVSCRSLGN